MQIQEKLARFPVPDKIWDEYHLDQEINDRGIRVDMPFVRQAIALDGISREKLTASMKELTDLENPNSVVQMKTWLSDNGIETDSLGKKDVKALLKDSEGNVGEVLSMRLQLARSSVRKYQAMENAVSGLSLSGTTFNHSNSITAQTAAPTDDSQDRARVVFPTVTVDATGHVSAVGTKKVKIELEHVTSSSDIDGTYATVTPSGTVSQPSFSGTQQTVNLSLTKTNGTRAFLTAAVDQAGGAALNVGLQRDADIQPGKLPDI